MVDSASRLFFFYGHLLKKGDPFVVARRGERERKGKLWWSVAPRAASGFFKSVVDGCVCRVKSVGIRLGRVCFYFLIDDPSVTEDFSAREEQGQVTHVNAASTVDDGRQADGWC